MAECEILMVISSHDLLGGHHILSKSFQGDVHGAAASYFYYLIVHFTAGTLNQFSGKNVRYGLNTPTKITIYTHTPA